MSLPAYGIRIAVVIAAALTLFCTLTAVPADASEHPPHELTANYTWSDDGKECTVNVFCLSCDYVAGIEHPEVKSKVKIPPTETVMGTTEYWVSGTVEGYDYYSAKDVQDIPVKTPSDDDDEFPVAYAAAAAAVVIILIGAWFFMSRRKA